MEYDLRKGQSAKLEGEGLRTIMSQCFGRVEEKDGRMVSSFGAITKVEVKLLDKTRIDVSAEMNKSAPADIQLETIKRWNAFLVQATGFTSKERGKRAQKKAKEGKL